MTGLPLTRHAEVRLIQRSIPAQIVEWIIDYGAQQRRFGADVYALDKRGRRKLRRALGDIYYRQVSGLLNTYVVMADSGAIVTAAHRSQRFHR